MPIQALDAIDQKILAALQANARLSNVELAHEAGLSPSPCFEDSIRALPEVMECYLMTGDSDYLLRVVTRDLQAYERFLMRHLTKFPGVSSIKSSFALKQVVYRTALPVSPMRRRRRSFGKSGRRTIRRRRRRLITAPGMGSSKST